MHRTCADKTRESEESFELQNAIQESSARSRNAILRFLAMAILVRHFICNSFLRSRPFATAPHLTRSPEDIYGRLHLGYGLWSFGVRPFKPDRTIMKRVRHAERCKNVTPAPKRNV